MALRIDFKIWRLLKMSYFRPFCLAIFSPMWMSHMITALFIHTLSESEYEYVIEWTGKWMSWFVNEGAGHCELKWVVWVGDKFGYQMSVCVGVLAWLHHGSINRLIDRYIDSVTEWSIQCECLSVHVGVVYMSEWVIGLVIVNGAGGMEGPVGW